MADETNDVNYPEQDSDEEEVKKVTTTGVIYMSFLPPNMTPLHIRQIFEKYGEVGRIFLQPKVKVGKRRIKPCYNKGSFTEGWIEFGDKNLAKKLALTFHNTLMQDDKRGKFTDHTWSLTYLHRFQWRHLTEQLTHERELQKQKLRIEQMQARKETDAYVASVDSGKMLAGMKERRKKKGRVWEERANPKRFKQRKTVEELRLEKQRNNLVSSKDSKSSVSTIGHLKPRTTVLTKIFGS